MVNLKLKTLRHVDPLLGNDRKTNNYTTAATRLRPVNNNRRTVFSVRSVSRYCNVDGQSGVFAVPSRAEPSRAAPRWLLHSVAVNTSRQRCHDDDSTSPSYYVTGRCWAIVQ
jgi:hypothetical protein